MERLKPWLMYEAYSDEQQTVDTIENLLKRECSVFKKKIIMDENDTLSEYNKISLGHNRTNGVVYSKIYFKVEICSAHQIFESHPTLHFPR